MKKVFFTLALLVFTLATYAQPTVPSTNEISVENFSIKQGKAATFDILLSNPDNTDLTVWQIYFDVPEGFTLGGAAVAERTKAVDGKDFVVDCVTVGGSTIRYMATGYHNPQATIPGTSGAIMTLTLTAPADAVIDNDYTIYMNNIMVSNMANEELDVVPASFTVHVVADKLDLYDDADALPAVSTGTENVVLHRDLKANIWNSFVVPFDMNADQIEEAFGEGALVAEFSGWNADDPNEAEEISLEFTSTATISANTPVIVKPTKAATAEQGISITAVDGINPDDAEVPVKVKVGGKNRTFTFTGAYVPTEMPEEYSLYLKNDKFYYAAPGTTIKGYRAYLVNDNTFLYELFESGVKIMIDSEATAIECIDADRTNGKVYTIDGKFVGKDVNFNRMQKGVYIVNGKKVIK